MVENTLNIDLFLVELEISFFAEADPDSWVKLAKALGEKKTTWDNFRVKFASLPDEISVGKTYFIGDAHKHDDDRYPNGLHWVINVEPILSDSSPPKELVDTCKKTGDINSYFEKISSNWPALKNINAKIEAKFVIDMEHASPLFWPKNGFPRNKTFSVRSQSTNFTPVSQSFEVNPSVGYINNISLYFDRKGPLIILDANGRMTFDMDGNFYESILKAVNSDVSSLLIARGKKND